MQQIQEDRQRELKLACMRHNLTKDTMVRAPFYNAITFDSLELAVCQVPKAGSSFWKSILGKKYNAKVAHGNFEVANEKWKEYFRLTFVRHPLYRLFSAYNDKIVGMEKFYIKYAYPLISKLRDGDRSDYSPCWDDISFEEFVKLVISQIKKDPYTVDVHWSPYYGLCKTCEMDYQFIGKVETFKTDLQLLQMSLKTHNVTLDVDNYDHASAYLNDKCRQMNLKDTNAVVNLRECRNVEKILSRKLQSLWNKGFTEEFGFTIEAFKRISKRKWKQTCMDIAERNILSSESRKKLVRARSKRVAKEGIKQLDPELLQDLIDVLQPDFEMFDYDPMEPFKS